MVLLCLQVGSNRCYPASYSCHLSFRVSDSTGDATGGLRYRKILQRVCDCYSSCFLDGFRDYRHGFHVSRELVRIVAQSWEVVLDRVAP